MGTETAKKVAWVAFFVSLISSCFWSYWGINENFHEGWYHSNIWSNLSLMFGRFLLAPLVFIAFAVTSIIWNKVGAILHLLLSIYVFFIFGNMNGGILLISVPLFALGILYWYGLFVKKRTMIILISVLPFAILIIFGSLNYVRVSGRSNDQFTGKRLIVGNNVELMWAPEGPGWPNDGTTWQDAKNISAHLSEDGSKLLDSSIYAWRLPTIEEAVASQVYHSQNAGGVWDNKKKTASYTHSPDKETPLWNPNTQTIYWWTSTEVNDRQAYIIVYNGSVYPRDKSIKANYLNFRAVRQK